MTDTECQQNHSKMNDGWKMSYERWRYISYHNCIVWLNVFVHSLHDFYRTCYAASMHKATWVHPRDIRIADEPLPSTVHSYKTLVQSPWFSHMYSFARQRGFSTQTDINGCFSFAHRLLVRDQRYQCFYQFIRLFHKESALHAETIPGAPILWVKMCNSNLWIVYMCSRNRQTRCRVQPLVIFNGTHIIPCLSLWVFDSTINGLLLMLDNSHCLLETVYYSPSAKIAQTRNVNMFSLLPIFFFYSVAYKRGIAILTQSIYSSRHGCRQWKSSEWKFRCCWIK